MFCNNHGNNVLWLILILILFYHYEKVEAEVHEYLAQKGTDAK